MMPVHLIDALWRTVDGDRRSPVADAVMLQWNLPPGEVRWVRSSACHVFVAGQTGYLRFVPDAVRSASSFAAIASLMAGLSSHAVTPLPSASGRLTETVDTPLGVMHAMLVTAAPGSSIEVDDLNAEMAQAWGAALARLHEATAGKVAPQQELFAELSELDDHRLAAHLQSELAEVPHDGIGVIHGDFELDNLAWSDGVPTVFDFDEATVSWLPADVAIAVRDIAFRPALLGAFLAGYRSIRSLDTTHLNLFARAYAACSAVRVRKALSGGNGDELPELRARLRQHIVRQLELAQA